MKKNLLNLLIICMLALGGCEGILDLNPPDKISPSTFWLTKGNFDMALTACYGALQMSDYGLYNCGTPNFDCITDNGYGQHSWGSTKMIVTGEISSLTGGYISSLYQDSYRGIARINIFLDQVKNAEANILSESENIQFEAEACFLRALNYWSLYFFYGDAPLILEPLTFENMVQPKTEAANILTQILKDLDFAISNLNDVPYYSNAGHAVVSSAQAFKARVLMFAAYDASGIPDLTILTQARDLTLEVQAEAYSLSPVYEDLFLTAGQHGNPEIIFSINFLAPDNIAMWDKWYGHWIAVSPLRNFIDAFECTDGLPWGVSPLTDLDAPFNNRDPRLRKTVFIDHPEWDDGRVSYPSNSRPNGYGLFKFCDPSYIPYDHGILSEEDAVILRLGEVLLMYAEAQNEINGPDETVYEAMNSIRIRAGMPPLPTGLTKEEMREKIRHERRIELAFENALRYYDLKRWRIASEILPNVTDGLLTYKWEDRFYKWPYSQSEIDISQGVLVQNPDY